jgi:hypothetical protein
MMTRKKIINNEMKTKIGLLIFVVILISCFSKNRIVNFSDVTVKSETELNHADTTKRIFKIYLAFEGEVNGEVFITIRNGYNYKKQYKFAKGKVDFKIRTDWYNTRCIVNYEPQGVTKGKLFLEYKFYEY